MCTILYSCPGNFYPRSPCGERLAKQLDRSPPLTFLSTLSLRRATVGASQGANIEHISIHALLAESDTPTLESLTPTQTFLSTLSLRRATRPVSALYSVNRYFYPRSPCGERHLKSYLLQASQLISIHALLAESDWRECQTS